MKIILLKSFYELGGAFLILLLLFTAAVSIFPNLAHGDFVFAFAVWLIATFALIFGCNILRL